MAEYLCMVVPALVHLLASTWLIEYVLTMQNVRQWTRLLFLGWIWPPKTKFPQALLQMYTSFQALIVRGHFGK